MFLLRQRSCVILTKAYRQGWDCAAQKPTEWHNQWQEPIVIEKLCPYKKGSTLREEWLQGWRDRTLKG